MTSNDTLKRRILVTISSLQSNALDLRVETNTERTFDLLSDIEVDLESALNLVRKLMGERNRVYDQACSE